jgi:hypothetical protein
MKKHRNNPKFKNTIRIWHPNPVKEIFIHPANTIAYLFGCYSISKGKPIITENKFVSLYYTSDALDDLKTIYDEFEENNSTSGDFGFLLKTDSSIDRVQMQRMEMKPTPPVKVMENFIMNDVMPNLLRNAIPGDGGTTKTARYF